MPFSNIQYRFCHWPKRDSYSSFVAFPRPLVLLLRGMLQIPQLFIHVHLSAKPADMWEIYDWNFGSFFFFFFPKNGGGGGLIGATKKEGGGLYLCHVGDVHYFCQQLSTHFGGAAFTPSVQDLEWITYKDVCMCFLLCGQRQFGGDTLGGNS